MSNREDADQSAEGDYEVGYGKPPKHSRFKPGQSGNPKGRPRVPATSKPISKPH